MSRSRKPTKHTVVGDGCFYCTGLKKGREWKAPKGSIARVYAILDKAGARRVSEDELEAI